MRMIVLLLCFASLMGSVKSHLRRTQQGATVLDESLYKGNKVDEFLALCYYPQNPSIQPDDFESYYLQTMGPTPTEPRCTVLDVGIHVGMSSEDIKAHVHDRFESLRHAQKVVRDYHHAVTTNDYYLLLGIVVFIVFGGIYLVAVGHYDWRSLLDEYHTDGSLGIPCWQYLRMQYVAAKVRGTTRNKTLLVPIFEKGVEVQEKDEKKEEEKKG